MSSGVGLGPREATSALRHGTAERLKLAFRRVVEAYATQQTGDSRDWMVGLAPFIDCSRRLGLDAAEVLGPIARTGPEGFSETFDAFVQRGDVTLAAFGWAIVDTPDGPAYRPLG